MKEKNWQIASTRDELNSLKPGTQAYAYNKGFAGDALDYIMDMESDDITLAEFTQKGIDLLEDNKKGFFMMIEGGKIDWACHANDGAASIHNTVAFDDAIKVALDFYNEHPNDTLIVVTGDHECGGLTLGFAGTGYETSFSQIGNQKMSYEAFDKFVLKPFKEENPKGQLAELLPKIEEVFGLKDLSDFELAKIQDAFNESMLNKEVRSKNEETALLYGGYEPLSVTLTHILNNRAGLAWTSYSHTGIPVPTFAHGVGAEIFNGYYDNTDVFHKTASIMKLATDQKVAMK